MVAKLLRLTDRYIGFLIYLLVWTTKPVFTKKGGSVLVVKLWAIGESILVLPSIRALSDKSQKVYVLCTEQNKVVFENQKFIEKTIVFDPRPWKALKTILSLRKYNFAVAIDSDPYMKFSAALTILSGARNRYGLENRKHAYTTHVKINEDEHALHTFYKIFSAFIRFPRPKKLVPLITKPVKVKPGIAIHAGSADTSSMRRWPEENFAEVCNYFTSRKLPVYLIGSQSEREINQRIHTMCKDRHRVLDMSGKLSMQEVASLFSKMKLVIANDSGPMHVSASMGTPTLGLFGPNLPSRFGPVGRKCMGIRKDGPVCILPFRGHFPKCKHTHMENLSVNEVLKAAKHLQSK